MSDRTQVGTIGDRGTDLPTSASQQQAIKPEMRDDLPRPAQGTSPSIEGLHTSIELSQVTIADIRRGNFSENLQLILKKFIEIAGKEETLPYLVISNFEKNPANKLFVQTALALMDDTSPDRREAYSKAAEKVRSQFGESLSKEEFEAFTAFKEAVGRMI